MKSIKEHSPIQRSIQNELGETDSKTNERIDRKHIKKQNKSVEQQNLGVSLGQDKRQSLTELKSQYHKTNQELSERFTKQLHGTSKDFYLFVKTLHVECLIV